MGKEKQAKEIEEHEAEIQREQEMLQRELEDKKLAKQKIIELSQKLDDVGKEIAKEEGLVLVEKMTLKKSSESEEEDEQEEEENKETAKKEEEKMEEESSDEDVDSEGNLIVKKCDNKKSKPVQK